MYDGTVTLCQKIILIFYSCFSLPSLISLCLSLTFLSFSLFSIISSFLPHTTTIVQTPDSLYNQRSSTVIINLVSNPYKKSSPQSTDLHYDHQQTLIPTIIAENSHCLCHIGPRFVLQFHRWRSVWWHDWVRGRCGGFLDRWWWVSGFGVVIVVVVNKIRGGG